MSFEKKVPEWTNEGTEASESLKEKGFEGGYKPPASVFNWFFHGISEAVQELQDTVYTKTDKPTASDIGAASATDLSSHTSNTSNPHSVTKAQVGLGNVDNTSDANKPVSTAQATAIADAKKAGTDAQTNLTSHTSNTSNPHSVTASQVGLGNVPNVTTNNQTPTYSDTTTFATLASGEKLSVALAKIKLAITNLINHINNTSNPHGVTKTQVGLSNVDNTSDANKPVSTAQATAIADAKAAGTTAQTDLESHTSNTSNPHGVTKSQIGLGNVDNTADSAKSVASAAKLTTARTIGVSGGVTGTATSFDGSANITIPVTALDPSKLSTAVPVAKGGTGATTAAAALTNLGLTATATELNYMEGVTSNVQAQLDGKAETDLSNVETSDFALKEREAEQEHIHVASSTDGVAYTVTVDGITELYDGLKIRIMPDLVSSSQYPTLDVNGLGAIRIGQLSTFNNAATVPPAIATWMSANRPMEVTFHQMRSSATGAVTTQYWIADCRRPSASGLYGKVQVGNGGWYVSSDTTDDEKAEALEGLVEIGVATAEDLGSTVIKNVTVSSSGWLDETETTALYRYRIENTNITDNMSVDVNFAVTDYTDEEASSLVRATNAGVLAATTSASGYVDIYATSLPETDLVCDLVLTTLKEV